MTTRVMMTGLAVQSRVLGLALGPGHECPQHNTTATPRLHSAHRLVCRFVGASLQFLRPIFYCVYSTQITVYIPPKRNKSLRNALAYCSRFFRTSHPLTIQGVPV